MMVFLQSATEFYPNLTMHDTLSFKCTFKIEYSAYSDMKQSSILSYISKGLLKNIYCATMCLILGSTDDVTSPSLCFHHKADSRRWYIASVCHYIYMYKRSFVSFVFQIVMKYDYREKSTIIHIDWTIYVELLCLLMYVYM